MMNEKVYFANYVKWLPLTSGLRNFKILKNSSGISDFTNFEKQFLETMRTMSEEFQKP